MKQNKVVIIAIVSFLVGLSLAFFLLNYSLINTESSPSVNASQSDQDAPLYWVAPMDPNFKRDQPGKSPMGMDLVPVYANKQASNGASTGTIEIDPRVINTLGVRTSTASKMKMSESINAIGYVTYNEDTLVHIHPRVSGWVERLYVKAAGEYIKKDAPLYALYSPELVNAQEEYLLALQRSNENLISAAKSRLQALHMPKQAIDQLKTTRTIQQTVDFYAPQTGFVDNLPIRQGFFVQPTTTLMSIGALDQVWIDAEIMASQSNKIELGLPVIATFEYIKGKSFTGKIDYIYPSVQASSRALRARVRIDNPDYAVKPNMFAKLMIETNANAQSVLVVPQQSIIRTGMQNRVVMALGEGKFKSVEISMGNTYSKADTNYVEVLAGLSEGDKIVTSAQFLLDSESSIHSDFKRMQSDSEPATEMPNTVWTQAIIIEVLQDERIVTLEHGPLDDWNMPAMTMDFKVAEQIDISSLKEGQSIHTEIGKHSSGMFELKTVHISEDKDDNEAPSHGDMQHD